MSDPSPYMKKYEIKDIHPVSDQARQRAEAAGLFPRRIQLAPHIAGWRRSEVKAWEADPAAWVKQSTHGSAAPSLVPNDLAEDL